MCAPPYRYDDDELGLSQEGEMSLSLVRVRKREGEAALPPIPAIEITPSIDITDFQQVAQRYHNVLVHVELATRNVEVPLSENQLWNLIARTVSVEWSQAYQSLQVAQQSFGRYDSGEEKPLGPIGAALEGVESTQAYDDLVMNLSNFTIIDEDLRQKEDLRLLLDGLTKRQKILTESADLTSFISASNDILADATSDITPARLHKVFGLLTRPFKKEAVQPKAIAP